MFFLLFEILLLMAFCRIAVTLARARGLSGCLFGFVFLALAGGGWFSGTTAAVALAGRDFDDERPNPYAVFVGGVLGIVAGATVTLLMLKVGTPRPPAPPPTDGPDGDGW